jgi:hypothetical protein
MASIAVAVPDPWFTAGFSQMSSCLTYLSLGGTEVLRHCDAAGRQETASWLIQQVLDHT